MDRARTAVRIPLAAGPLCAALALAGCADDARPRPPSVLLISIDTLRADHVHCLGYERETTPRIDALAAAGARFTQHVSNTSWTLPSHVSMLTGLPETMHGVESDDRVLDAERTTLAEILRARGYRTAGFFSGPYLHPTYGIGQGFEVYESAIVLEKPADRESAWDRISDTDRLRLIERHSYQVTTGPELALRSTAWLDALRADEPFLLFVHFFDPHWDYMAPERYWRLFDPDFDDADFDGSMFIANPDIHASMDARRLHNLIARYDGEIRFTDDMVGRVLDHLERLGRSDDTLVVITSDHGEEFFEHGQKGHRNNLFDESLRIPLVIKGPGVPRGARVSAQTSIIDVTPTILDLAGVPALPEMIGRSLLPLLGADVPADLAQRNAYGRLVLDGAPLQTRFLRTPRRKLLATRGSQEPGAELLHYFDLERDPAEQAPRVGRSDARDAWPEMAAAFAGLVRQEEQERLRAARLPLLAPGARPDIDAALREQLRQNGYLGN